MSGPEAQQNGAAPSVDADAHAPGFLAGMRIRKKLVFLHTVFSLVLAAVLLVTINPVANEVVLRAEADEAMVVLKTLLAQSTIDAARLPENVEARRGSASDLELDQATVDQIRASAPEPVTLRRSVSSPARVVTSLSGDGPEQFLSVAVTIPEARRAVVKLYGFLLVAILGVYAVIAGTLELFVLPKSVYRPIRQLLEADSAVQRGDVNAELIPDHEMPQDELGEIMRSRNASILSMREHESALSAALLELEVVASDLKRKNHMLEAARRSMADADRLASLGMMSAGIAHELNTPLTVVKGLAERLDQSGLDEEGRRSLSKTDAALMLRVVKRLERLGESLLDYARVRPSHIDRCELAALIDEARTLVRLDRSHSGVEVLNTIGAEVVLWGDSDRLVQVFVNVLRNAVDAAASRVEIRAHDELRDGESWVTVEISDDGEGLASETLATLFEPFVSTKLDAKGTGLGLAVSDAIVREHGGVITAFNQDPSAENALCGAVFRITLPRGENTSELDGQVRAKLDQTEGDQQ